MTDVPAEKSAPELQISDVAGTVSGLFSMLADAMPQIVWATDADGSHFYYNRRWYEYTGMTEADSMGFGFSIPLHPDDYARTIQRWRQAWEAGEDYDIEYRFRRHDGVYRWFVGRATPIRDTHSGEVRMWIGTCTDIDDARRAFDGLGESQGRLALALQTARLGTWEYDYATRGFEFSPRTMELFGVTNSAVSFDEWAALLHEDDQNTVVTAATAIIGQTPPYEADDAVIRVQYRTRRPDNTIRHLLVMGARLFGADGNAVRIVGVAQDVSEERDTLDALRESADALRESESRLRSVVSNAPIVVFAVNKDGVFTFSDGAALASLGLKPGQVVGTSVFDLYADHPDIVAYIRRALGGEIITWSAVVGGTHFETQCTPVTNDRGEIEGIIAVAFDTTEKSEAAEALAAREEQYRFLFNTVASGVVYQDGEARILDANPAAEEILGLTLRQMIGMYSFDSRWKAVREDGSDLPNEEHPVPIALRTGQIVRAVPMGVYHPVEGRYRWLSVTAVPLTRPGASKPHLVYAYLDDYTERREAEAALRESESRFRSVLRAAPIVVFALDRNGVFLLHDGAGLIAAGREPGFSVGRSVWDVYADFPGLLEPTRSALAGETTEWRTSVHGVTYDTKAIAVRDENGAMNGIIGVSFDVSEQDKAEKSLRESESRFRDLADNISQLAWMTDETGYIFWYNQRWFDYTGTTLEEMRGWGWQKVQHPDYVWGVTEKFTDHVNRGEIWEDTFPLRGADGSYRWFLSRAVPLRDEDGKIVRWFGTNTDVTDSRRADEEIRRSEERFRSLITATAQIVWTTRASGAFMSAQPAWAAFTGQSPDEYKGAGWLEAVHEDDRDDAAQQWQEAVATHNTFMTEHRLRRGDGVYRYMLVRAVPVLETGGAVREWIGVHTDITERKKAEFALSEYATRQARVAETLQRSLLNAPPSRAFPGVTISTKYESALDEAQVGGDFFDAFALSGGRIALVVGDVTGKGLKAAEHTGQIKYALRAFLRENPAPADALSRVNRLLTDAQLLDSPASDEDNSAMASATVAVLDPTTGQLFVAGGGAEYPLVYRANRGACEEINTSGLVVGAYAEGVYEVTESLLGEGDLLILTTDGITEARRGQREFFGNDGLAAIVENIARQTSDPEAVALTIIDAARRYSAGGTFRDDVCLLVLRRD